MLSALARLNPISPTQPAKGFYKANRQRFLEILRSLVNLETGYLLFKGPIEQPVYDDDTEFLSVGESNFSFLFGVDEPHTWGLIDLQTDKATLLVEETNPERSFWMKVKTLEDFQNEFDGDSVAVIKDFPSLIGFTEENKGTYSRKIYVMEGPNAETNASLLVPTAKEVGEHLGPYFTISSKVYAALKHSRKRKSDEEIRLLLNAAETNAKVTCSLLAYVKEGKSELQVAHHFGALAMYFGNLYPAFTPQIAFGNNALKALHNPSKLRVAKNGELAVIDSGLRINGLVSRLLRTVPVSGKFSAEQKDIYDKVLGIYQRVIQLVKNGLVYADLVKAIEKELETFLVSEKVCASGPEVILAPATIKKFYEDDVLAFIGYDLADPLTTDYRRGDQIGFIEDQAALFLKLAIRFDPQLTEGDVAINQERVRELSQVVPAIKLGDLLVTKPDTVLNSTIFFPVEAPLLELLHNAAHNAA